MSVIPLQPPPEPPHYRILDDIDDQLSEAHRANVRALEEIRQLQRYLAHTEMAFDWTPIEIQLTAQIEYVQETLAEIQ